MEDARRGAYHASLAVSSDPENEVSTAEGKLM